MRHIEKTNRNTAKKGVVAAAALFAGLAALPALAATPQDMVISRLSNATSEVVPSEAMTSQTLREPEYSNFQEQVVSRLASHTAPKAHSKSAETEEGLLSGAPFRVSQYVEQAQRDIQAHLHGN